MRILGTIVLPLALAVLDIGQYFSFRCAVTPQLVGDDRTRDIPQVLST